MADAAPAAPPPGKAWLNTNEVAELLGYHPATVRRWIGDGRIKAKQPGGKRGDFRVHRSEVDRILNEGGAPEGGAA